MVRSRGRGGRTGKRAPQPARRARTDERGRARGAGGGVHRGPAAAHPAAVGPPPEPTNRFADDPRAAQLGRALFYDPRLSRSGELSCASCHLPELAFSDGKRVAEGTGLGQRNTPSLWNAAHQRWYFWDGRADTLWSQALGPLENALEFDGSRTAIARLLAADPALRSAYGELFGPLPESAALPPRAHPGDDDEAQRAWDALTAEQRQEVDAAFVNVGKALEAFQRRLQSDDSRFDRFAALLAADDPGARDVLTASEQRGLELFIGKAACRTCHSGPNFTDGEFHGLGLPPAADPGSGAGLAAGVDGDAGRWQGLLDLEQSPFNAAGPSSDDPGGERARRLRASLRTPDLWGQFKTPSLRNVALTAPYMHTGQFETIEAVLDFYNTLAGAQLGGHHQEVVLVPLGLSERELADLAAFLRTLTDAELDPELGDPNVAPHASSRARGGSDPADETH